MTSPLSPREATHPSVGSHSPLLTSYFFARDVYRQGLSRAVLLPEASGRIRLLAFSGSGGCLRSLGGGSSLVSFWPLVRTSSSLPLLLLGSPLLPTPQDPCEHTQLTPMIQACAPRALFTWAEAHLPCQVTVPGTRDKVGLSGGLLFTSLSHCTPQDHRALFYKTRT